MFRRTILFLVLALTLLALAGCSRHNKRVTNPLANLGSKQPDKVLFDRAMDQMKHNKFDQARMLLQTLINTYPDSEFIARAKLAVGDSWYAEGGSAALAQAENEYKDFQTFFPNMANEASEAQMKIAEIHYRQMEKPDRDYTHAKRAEEEYRTMILQYPDSPLVPKAKERLREVQEVLAEREYRVGRFYYLRENWPASIARLKSLVDTYPLYSSADDALYMLGSIYEREIDAIRASKFDETKKGALIKPFTDQAAEAYSRIITRYPVSDRAGDAKKQLQALHRPVPTPTPEAIALNKQEIASREEMGRISKFMLNLHKRPDTSLTAHVGEPTLVDPKQTDAPDILRQNSAAVMLAVGGGKPAEHQVSAETVKSGEPAANQPVPRSDNQPDNSGIEQLQPIASGDGTNAAAQPAATTEPPTGAQPAATQPAQTPPPAPVQVNEAKTGDPATAAASSSAKTDTAQTDPKNDEKSSSSSKKKKKKGLGKLNPF